MRRWWHDLWSTGTAAEQVPPLLTAALALGLPACDVGNAQDMIEQAEWQLAFDIVVMQLFEYAIPITADFYEQVETGAESMAIAPEAYSFLLLLVKK